MTITTLFSNLSEYTEAEVEFEEEISSLEFSESANFFVWSNLPIQILEFAKGGKQRSCKKGYPCGGSCISKNYACKKAVKGEAKNFGEFLKNQKNGKKAKPKTTAKKKSTPKKAVKPQNTKNQKPEAKQEPSWRDLAKANRVKSELDAFNDRDKDFFEVPAGTYKNNGKTIKVSGNEGGTQDVEIDDVSKLYTKNLPRESVEATIEHYTSPMQGTKDELGEAYEMRSRPPIKSKEEFSKEFDEAFEKLDPEGTGLVEVNKVRRALGDRLSREEFDNYFYDSSIEKYTPSGGSLGNYGNSGADPAYASALRDSLVTELDGFRTYFQKD
jgi:hypothetical protein